MKAALERIADAIEKTGLHLARTNHPLAGADDLAARVEVAARCHRDGRAWRRAQPDYDHDDEGVEAIERRLRADQDMSIDPVPRVNMSGRPV